jgi:hypothetical protein
MATERRMSGAPGRRRRPPEAPRLLGVEEVARVGRLVHRRLYVLGHHPNLGRPIMGQSGPETVIELFGAAP